MFADHLWSKTSILREWNSFGKVARRDLNLMSGGSESIYERCEKRNVRRVC